MTEWKMKTAYEKHSGESWNDAQPFARELWENAWVTAKSERGVSASSAQIDEIYLSAQDSRPLSEFREEIRSILSSPQPASEPVEEGCTPADAKMLRAANHGLADENTMLRRRLRPFAALANPRLSWAMVEYCIDGDPEKQTLQAPQMQRAFNRAAEALSDELPSHEPADCEALDLPDWIKNAKPPAPEQPASEQQDESLMRALKARSKANAEEMRHKDDRILQLEQDLADQQVEIAALHEDRASEQQADHVLVPRELLQDFIDDAEEFAASREFKAREVVWRDKRIVRARALLAAKGDGQ